MENLLVVFACNHCPFVIHLAAELGGLHPGLFLFAPDDKVFYTGQFDDSRPHSDIAPHGGDLHEAVRRMLDDEEPLVRPYPSSGCNIKWKPGSEPALP